MQNSSERILTTHVGSLPRPKDLADLILKRHGKTGEVDEQQFRRAVAEATNETVAKQVDAGVDVVSDGEIGKNGYIDYVIERLIGYEGAVDPTKAFYFNDLLPVPELTYETYKDTRLILPICKGEVTYVGQEAVDRDVANLKAALGQHDATEAFMPAASPGVIAMFFSNAYYKSFEDYIFAVADAMRTEYKAITDAGFLVQLDAPDLAFGADIHWWASDVVNEKGLRWSQDVQVEAINRSLDGIPREKVRLHVCWANYMGPHTHDLPLAEVLQPVARANVQGISFEGANPAHVHEWEIFKDVKLPDDQIILPGVIDTKSQVVEHPRAVAQRVVQYANLVGKERVIASTDCGFGTFIGLGTVHPVVSWMKLKSLKEGAALASQQLY